MNEKHYICPKCGSEWEDEPPGDHVCRFCIEAEAVSRVEHAARWERIERAAAIVAAGLLVRDGEAHRHIEPIVAVNFAVQLIDEIDKRRQAEEGR